MLNSLVKGFMIDVTLVQRVIEIIHVASTETVSWKRFQN